jgi:hypothetical protein
LHVAEREERREGRRKGRREGGREGAPGTAGTLLPGRSCCSPPL